MVSLLEQVVARARLFDLGRDLERGMPQSPNHPPFQMILERRHGDRIRADGTSGANEIIVTGGHVGTHVDALSHFSYQGCLHGGIDAAAAQAGGRFRHHGAETLPLTFRRGVLLDVVAHLGEDAGAPGRELTRADLERTAAAAGIALRPGDAVLVRTGWSRRWGDRDAFLSVEGGTPGPGPEAATFLCDGGAAIVGSDTLAFEHIAPGKGLSELPCHRILLVDRGVPIIEMLDLEALAAAGIAEFLFVMAPLKLVGATASPVRPMAVVL